MAACRDEVSNGLTESIAKRRLIARRKCSRELACYLCAGDQRCREVDAAVARKESTAVNEETSFCTTLRYRYGRWRNNEISGIEARRHSIVKSHEKSPACAPCPFRWALRQRVGEALSCHRPREICIASPRRPLLFSEGDDVMVNDK